MLVSSTTTELSTTAAATKAEALDEKFISIQTDTIDIIVTVVLIVEMFIFVGLLILLKSEENKPDERYMSSWLMNINDDFLEKGSKKRADETLEKLVQWEDDDDDAGRENLLHDKYLTYVSEKQNTHQ